MALGIVSLAQSPTCQFYGEVERLDESRSKPMTRFVLLSAVALAMLVFVACAAETVVTVIVTPTPGPNPTPIIQTVVVPVIQTVVVPATPQIRIVVATPTIGPTPVPLVQTIIVTPTPGPTATPFIQTVVVTATPAPTNTPTPTMQSMPGMSPGLPEIQEIGLIENYAIGGYFPSNIVVLKDIPVRIFLTRLHREHINKFAIDPFYSSSQVILPGEIGVIEFVPDRVGEFRIRNVGHGAVADLIVVETQQEAREYIEARGRQMYALIHSVDDFRIYPELLVVHSGIPVTIHNISLIDQHQVSIESFLSPENVNVMPGEISRFEFTPNEPGIFTIRHELHGFTGNLIVAEAP